MDRLSSEAVALSLVRSAQRLAFFAMLTVAFSTALVGTRHPLYQQLCWRPVSVVPQVAAGQAQLIWVPEAGQGQLIWVPEAGQAHPPWMPVEAGQAQPFWMPAAPEAVVRPAFLPPHPRTKVQPERFSWPVKAVRVHPSSALEDQAAVVQGRLFSEPEEAGQPQAFLPQGEAQEPAWLHPLPPCPPPSLPPLRVALRF